MRFSETLLEVNQLRKLSRRKFSLTKMQRSQCSTTTQLTLDLSCRSGKSGRRALFKMNFFTLGRVETLHNSCENNSVCAPSPPPRAPCISQNLPPRRLSNTVGPPVRMSEEQDEKRSVQIAFEVQGRASCGRKNGSKRAYRGAVKRVHLQVRKAREYQESSHHVQILRQVEGRSLAEGLLLTFWARKRQRDACVVQKQEKDRVVLL